MTNYSQDEDDRQELKISEARKSQVDSIKLGKDEEPWEAINIEIPEEDFVRIAHAAHTRDITINKMVNIILKKSLKDLSYRYEHNNKPQLLNEDN